MKSQKPKNHGIVRIEKCGTMESHHGVMESQTVASRNLESSNHEIKAIIIHGFKKSGKNEALNPEINQEIMHCGLIIVHIVDQRLQCTEKAWAGGIYMQCGRCQANDFKHEEFIASFPLFLFLFASVHKEVWYSIACFFACDWHSIQNKIL
jgi:hypothetical protein